MLKKIIIGIIVLNVFLVGWFFRGVFPDFFSKTKEVDINSQQVSKETTTESDKKEISYKEGKIIGEGEIKIASYFGDKIIYYNRNNFLETDLEGSYKKNLATFPFQNFSYGKCSRLGNVCLISSKGVFSVFNLGTKSNFELEKRITDVDFNSQGDGLVYLFKEGNDYILNTSSLGGENWIRLKNIPGENVKIKVSPQSDQFVFYSSKIRPTSKGLFLSSLLEKEGIQKISDNEIIDASFSPDGEKILFSFYDYSVSPRRVQLGYYDLNQKKQSNLGLPSIAQKCAWSKDAKFIVCAALSSKSPGEFVLEDWYGGRFVSRDIFWKIDLLKGERKKIFVDFAPVDSFSLILENGRLFFLDKLSGSLISREL